MDSIYENAIQGNCEKFTVLKEYIKPNPIRLGLIDCSLPKIKDKNFNTRCNTLILKNLELLKEKLEAFLNKYDRFKIGIICATTNSGVEEYETTKNHMHYELGNPAYFLRNYLNLKGYYATVSTACSSGIKAFSLARDLINKQVIDSAIVVCVDSISKLSVYGFNSLEVLTDKPCNPFSKNRTGMNIGEACSIFMLEKEGGGIEIMV